MDKELGGGGLQSLSGIKTNADVLERGAYQALFDHDPHPVYILDSTGICVYGNPAFLTLWSDSREHCSLSFAQTIVDNLLEQGNCLLEQVLNDKPHIFEAARSRQDGIRVTFKVTLSPIVNEGFAVGVLGTCIDITEHKLTEKMLKDRTERYESLKRYNPNGICSFHLDGRAVGLNPAFERMTGYSLEELRNVRVSEVLVFEEDAMWVKETFQPGVFLENVETRIRHKDGHCVNVLATTVPIIVDGHNTGVFVILQDITKQKLAQRELFETQKLYRMISENSQDLITSSGPDGICRYVSPSVRDTLGYEPSEVIGTPILNYYHPDDLGHVMEIGRRILQGEDVDRFTCRVCLKNGNYRWFETTLRIVRDAQGQLLELIGVGRDVSDQIELQESLEHALRIAHLGHWDWAVQTNLLTWSPHLYEIMGLVPSLQPLTYETFASLIHPLDLELVNQHIQRCLDSGIAFDREFRIVHEDGSIRYLHGQAEVFFDDTGKPQRMFGTVQDITSSKMAELKLKQSEVRYRRLVDNSLDAVGVIEDGRWVYLNATGLKLFGAQHEHQVIGKHYTDFLHPDHHVEFYKRSDSILAGETLGFVERKFMKLNGEIFHALVSATQYGDSAIQQIIRDVTEQKRTDELLIRSEKLSAIGQLAAGVAHEIRNPLTSLKGFVQLMHGHSRGANKRYFDIMKSELDRIEMILSEMLILAKPQVVTFQPRDVELILQDVITLLNAQALMKNVVIEAELGRRPANALVNCEMNQLKQVFLNVVKNAIEAMPKGGHLFVRVGSEDNNVWIEFVDEGEGIPADRIPKLGEPFYSTKEKGTGLGLMISHKIIAAHGGNMEISSTVGKGTKVKITLPATGARNPLS